VALGGADAVACRVGRHVRVGGVGGDGGGGVGGGGVSGHAGGE